MDVLEKVEEFVVPEESEGEDEKNEITEIEEPTTELSNIEDEVKEESTSVYEDLGNDEEFARVQEPVTPDLQIEVEEFEGEEEGKSPSTPTFSVDIQRKKKNRVFIFCFTSHSIVSIIHHHTIRLLNIKSEELEEFTIPSESSLTTIIECLKIGSNLLILHLSDGKILFFNMSQKKFHPRFENYNMNTTITTSRFLSLQDNDKILHFLLFHNSKFEINLLSIKKNEVMKRYLSSSSSPSFHDDFFTKHNMKNLLLSEIPIPTISKKVFGQIFFSIISDQYQKNILFTFNIVKNQNNNNNILKVISNEYDPKSINDTNDISTLQTYHNETTGEEFVVYYLSHKNVIQFFRIEYQSVGSTRFHRFSESSMVCEVDCCSSNILVSNNHYLVLSSSSQQQQQLKLFKLSKFSFIQQGSNNNNNEHDDFFPKQNEQQQEQQNKKKGLEDFYGRPGEEEEVINLPSSTKSNQRLSVSNIYDYFTDFKFRKKNKKSININQEDVKLVCFEYYYCSEEERNNIENDSIRIVSKVVVSPNPNKKKDVFRMKSESLLIKSFNNLVHQVNEIRQQEMIEKSFIHSEDEIKELLLLQQQQKRKKKKKSKKERLNMTFPRTTKRRQKYKTLPKNYIFRYLKQQQKDNNIVEVKPKKTHSPKKKKKKKKVTTISKFNEYYTKNILLAREKKLQEREILQTQQRQELSLLKKMSVLKQKQKQRKLQEKLKMMKKRRIAEKLEEDAKRAEKREMERTKKERNEERMKLKFDEFYSRQMRFLNGVEAKKSETKEKIKKSYSTPRLRRTISYTVSSSEEEEEEEEKVEEEVEKKKKRKKKKRRVTYTGVPDVPSWYDKFTKKSFTSSGCTWGKRDKKLFEF